MAIFYNDAALILHEALNTKYKFGDSKAGNHSWGEKVIFATLCDYKADENDHINATLGNADKI